MLRIFTPEKSNGPQTWVPEASMLTTRPPKPSNISTIYIYITRLASNEILSPSNKIHGEAGRSKDLSALPCFQRMSR